MGVDTKLEDLPEEVLCGILSGLGMRDAARACASCSTLLRVWRMHAHLLFDEDTLGLRLLPEEEDELLDDDDDGGLDPHRRAVLENKKDELARDFVRFVDATLLRHRSDTALETLSVKLAYLQQRHAAMVDRWVHFAMESTTVRRLELDFVAIFEKPCGPTLCYDFPTSLLLHPCRGAMALEELHLRSGCLRWPPPCPSMISLSGTPTRSSKYVELTSLVLDTVRVTDQDLERFLCSCHKLQRLELNCCDELVHVKVPPSCLFLALRHCRSLETVDCSRVASLTFDTTNSLQPSILGSAAPAPSVTRASFRMMTNFNEPDAGNGIFESTSLARLMPAIQTLSLIVSIVKVVTPPSTWKFRHLKRLDLWMILIGKSRQRDDFIFLHRFLDAAPALESLSLNVRSAATAFDASQMPPRVDIDKQHRSSPHPSLKTVTITGFDAHLGFLELVLYILENARPLQRLSLDPAWYDVDTHMPQMNKPRDFKRQIAREAIARHIAPRISPHIALEVL